ncbi:energy transducer TonB [Flavobacterium faecale]|uniref:energy transducer TonB n=1 Tax=Flavobacterium faecale TaxID=1355330 RepID=UPI003AB0D1F5
MKSKLILLLILLISVKNYSQITTSINNYTENDKLIYLDSAGNITSEIAHKYYRIIKDYNLEKKNYRVFDYYRSGSLFMEGTSDNRELVLKNGLFTYYYENGNKKGVANYVNRVQEGEEIKWYKNGVKQSVKNYANGKLDGKNSSWYDNGNQKSTSFYIRGGVNGKVTDWYENGNKKSEVVYEFITTKLSATTTSKTTEVKINQFWDENGVQKVIDGNGDYEIDENNFYAQGKVKNGYYDGVWKGNYKNYNYRYNEIYKDNRFVSGEGIDKDNLTHQYTSIRTKPQPKNGITDLNKYIAKNFQMKNTDNFSGNLFVSIEVEADGTVSNVKIIKDIGNDASQELIRVLKGYKDWNPGELRGRKVKSTITLPIAI